MIVRKFYNDRNPPNRYRGVLLSLSLPRKPAQTLGSNNTFWLVFSFLHLRRKQHEQPN